MSAEQIDALFALALGFAFAGLIATGYQVFTQRPASFEQLQQRPRRVAFAAVPMLVFAAPFIIMRNTIRAARDDGRTFSAGDGGDRHRGLLEPDVRDRRADGVVRDG